jgi:hypothetical protein
LEFHGGSVSVFPKIKKWTVGAMRKKRKDAGQKGRDDRKQPFF